jgi:NAD(P)-dependent dehydrogenase (short-subunit alcohol dehydrogenase family)
MKVNYDFSGRVVLVAGAGSGIGLAMTRACLEAGATVLASDLKVQALTELNHPRCEVAQLDITDSGAVNRYVQAQHSRLGRSGRIDAAVLASGIQQRIPVEAMTDADWQRHIDVNLTGIFYMVRALFPVMKQQRCGAMVVFTSGLATQGWPGATAYGASKAGLIALVKSAAMELKDYGVRINAVSPGITNTPLFTDSASPQEVAMYENSLGVSEPQEVAPMLMHLISDGAASISGNVLERRMIPKKQ